MALCDWRYNKSVDLIIPEFQNTAGFSRGSDVGESSRRQWSASGVRSRSSSILDLQKRPVPDSINPRTRRFADDCILYRQITSETDQRLQKEDLDRLATWKNLSVSGSLWVGYLLQNCVRTNRYPTHRLYDADKF